ncbi:unnamed protein product [Urochloa humidicola]
MMLLPRLLCRRLASTASAVVCAASDPDDRPARRRHPPRHGRRRFKVPTPHHGVVAVVPSLRSGAPPRLLLPLPTPCTGELLPRELGAGSAAAARPSSARAPRTAPPELAGDEEDDATFFQKILILNVGTHQKSWNIS